MISLSRRSRRVFISYLDEPEHIKSHPLYPAIKLLNKFISKDAGAKAGRVPRVDELTAIIDDKDREIEHLNQKLKEAKQAELAVTEDYMMLLRILDRARALGVLNQSEAEDSKVSFKMDANGNLERIG